MRKLYAGIDIGGTMIKTGIFAGTGELIADWQIPTVTKHQGSYILPHIAASIRDYFKNHHLDEERLAGVGVGVPGPVLANGYLENCVNLGWGNVYPADELSKLLGGIPAIVGNDANMAAMGEYWQGSGKGYNSIVFITLGTGVGSGIILNGAMLYGAKGLCGEIGHISVNPEEPEVCNCGHRGCLDQMASAVGLVRNAKRLLARRTNSSVLAGINELSAKQILDAAKEGDVIAMETVDYCMNFLGKSISDVSYVVDPEVFIIGGGVSKAGEFLISVIRKHYEENAQLVSKKAEIKLAELGNQAGIYGAAKTIYDKIDKER